MCDTAWQDESIRLSECHAVPVRNDCTVAVSSPDSLLPAVGKDHDPLVNPEFWDNNCPYTAFLNYNRLVLT